MKKASLFLVSVILLVALPMAAQGVTPAVAIQPMSLITKLSGADQTYGMLVRGRNIYLFGNVTGVVSTDGYVQALDETGQVQWSLALDSGQNEIATAATIDARGSIWVLGSSATATLPSPSDTATATSAPSTTPTPIALNPDSVQVEPALPQRLDLTNVIAWKVSRSGNLLGTFTLAMSRPVLVRAAIGTSSGVAFAGITSTTSGSAGFYATSDLSGVMSKPMNLGRVDTELNALVKMAKNTVGIFGASSESISGTKLMGRRDGIISSVLETGKLGKVIRSSNAKSTRSWQSATNSLFLGGDAITAGKMEAVVTKFSSTFVPTWTTRYPSSSPAMTADGVISRFALFSSTSLIQGVKGWKPASQTSVMIAFDAKGAITGAYRVAGTPVSIGYTRDLGVVVLGRGALGVSIFHTLTR
ncbi:MAG TPA: hypothetical protein VMW30_09610 [Candidatus Paceibacterota bacterium]|nr:hypothetical protein [Candidatus Paceibacterota bacterium]